MSSTRSFPQREALKSINRKCKCEKRAIIRCSESPDHPNWLYYNYEARVCKFFDWVYPLHAGESSQRNEQVGESAGQGVDEAISSVNKESLLEIGRMKAEIEAVRRKMKKHKRYTQVVLIMFGVTMVAMFCINFMVWYEVHKAKVPYLQGRLGVRG